MFHLLISSLGVVLESLLKGGGGEKFGKCSVKIIAGEEEFLVRKQDLIWMHKQVLIYMRRTTYAHQELRRRYL